MDFPEIARASRLAVELALLTLVRKDFPGEAARARVMFDRYLEDVRLLLCSSPRIATAPALIVVRQAAAFVRHSVLKAELASRQP